MNTKTLTLWKNISQDNILFVLIDFQEKFFPLLKKKVIKLVKANILLLIKMFKELNIPMIGTEHYVKGLGHTAGDILNEWGDAPMTGKVTFNCCGDETSLLTPWKSLQKKQRFENKSLTGENDHAVQVAGVADPFLQNLEKYSRPVVVIAGLETHICVLQTVLDLLGRNYQVVVLTDAVISSTKLKWKNGIDLMKEAGAQILNTETLLFYLLKRVDKKEFKYLVTLLKEHQASLK